MYITIIQKPRAINSNPFYCSLKSIYTMYKILSADEVYDYKAPSMKDSIRNYETCTQAERHPHNDNVH